MAPSRRSHFEQHPTTLLVSRAVREAAIDRFGGDSPSVHQYEVAATYIFSIIQQYVDEALKTVERHQRYLQEMGESATDGQSWAASGAEKYEEASGLFEVKVHQYLTCWCMVARATKQLQKRFRKLRMDIPALGEPDIQKLFEAHTEVRDLFEHQLVLRSKSLNITGLQLADLVVTPIGRKVLGKPTHEDWEIVKSKLCSSSWGDYWGYGLVKLPR